MISGTATGYSLFKRCTPVFLRLAALHRDFWSDDSAISILNTIREPRYEAAQFVINDTILSLVLGTPPLLHYDTTPVWIAEPQFHYQLMYGFPIGVLLLLARINAWRASRIKGQASYSQNYWTDWEKQLDSWNPTIDYGDGPNNNIMRFMIQEAWRQATKIYLYLARISPYGTLFLFLKRRADSGSEGCELGRPPSGNRGTTGFQAGINSQIRRLFRYTPSDTLSPRKYLICLSC
jgi:hypothetical protein